MTVTKNKQQQSKTKQNRTESKPNLTKANETNKPNIELIQNQ